MKLKEAYSYRELEEQFSEEICNILHRDCQRFIDESKQLFLYRGIKSYLDEKDIVKFSVRKNRNPLTSCRTYFDYFNDELKKAGFKAIRSNSIICTGDKVLANSYGILCYIFPIGHYEYTWNVEMCDYLVQSWSLNDKEITGYMINCGNISNNEQLSAAKHIWNEYGKYYKKTDLDEAIESGNEILISCENYYAIRVNYNNRMKNV